MGLKEKLRRKIWELGPFDLEVKQEIERERRGPCGNSLDDQRHLIETTQWLCRAQDSSLDGGVARGFKTARYQGYGPYGWQPSYPETTGYIIPTMIALAGFLGQETLIERALRMADWEVEVQMAEGAVMGSVITAPSSPAVFNTGQVIFGWLAAFRESHRREYIEAALKAGDYLISRQEKDGSWDKDDSRYALRKATTYNTRVAWALIELGQVSDKAVYTDSGREFIELALQRQRPNGWFSQNCLNDPERPLLHTIIYATRGILEAGICLNESRYLEAALKTLDALLKSQRPDGGLPGRLASDWSAAADWDCLTGDAQAAGAWLRARAVTGRPGYRDGARRALNFVKRSQNLEHPNPGIRGGVKGSFPFDGEYGQFELLNWAAKFFCDALMMLNDEKLAERGIKG